MRTFAQELPEDPAEAEAETRWLEEREVEAEAEAELGEARRASSFTI